ncbi:MAG: helicase-exonuclease AddAB subunit AddA [Lawsonibacter sp.]|nr:helicase-exonuclease AddAB subunit AddA [Lawsonibacter sp.]
MPFPLTDEQKRIVEDQSGELLVSAAAGSGKTRVLVERLLDRVDREGLDIDRFLVITYTKAAAAELRSRIAQELAERMAHRPGARHLRRQTALVYQAQISTIHAFCAALLRENGHLLDLDPDFRMCDEGEAKVLLLQTLEGVLDRRYEGLEGDSSFAILADTLAVGRDDSRLSEIAADIFQRVQSHPDPVRWLEEQKRLWDLEGVTDLAQTSWGEVLLEDARRQAAGCRDRLELALALSGKDELLEQNYSPSILASLEGVEDFLRAESWDAAYACLPIPFPAAGRKRKRRQALPPMEEAQADQTGERVKAIRSWCKKKLDKLAPLLGGDSASLLEELSLSRPAVQALLDLVLDLQAAFSAEKRRRNLVDFSDLEHLAVRLLTDAQGNPTPLAESWGARFHEVLVDEYQDTNQVQNAIFHAISQGGRRLFQVGDVKQSIYRFRLADPGIFLDKYRRYPDGEGALEGAARRRILSKNFRSRPQVLEGCNDLFRSVMSREFGEVDYTDDQALVPGKRFPVQEGPDPYALELDCLDLSFLGEQQGEKEDKDLLEARFAARRVSELLAAPLMVTEGERQRPLRPSDVMILMRSPSSVLHHYLRALGEEGIPWSALEGGDLLNTTEVNVALSILRIVDNPRQDVALIAALCSPVYGFSGDKLALLRAQAEGDFYAALVRAAQEGDQECQSFLEELAALRFGAGDRTCRQLIWYIYEKTNLLGIFGAMDGGAERQGNLLSLYAIAGALEKAGCRSLFQFLLRLDRMRSTGARLTVPGPSQGEEGVSILTIHRSKGLEKPVVLVCGLSRRMNRDDFQRPVLFHPQLGVGPKGLDRDRMIEYSTPARRAVARRMEREMMAEELRLLYVAMTRAQEKLILTLSLPEGGRVLERLGEVFSVPPSPMVLESQQNVGQWILLHALARPEAGALRELAGLSLTQGGKYGPPWDIRWVKGLSLTQAESAQGRFAELTQDGPEELEALVKKLAWTYPHPSGASIPSKLTATQIKGRTLDREAAEEAAVQPGARPPIRRPDFMLQERGLTPAQRGTAIHLAMQYIPLEGDHSPRGVRAQLDRLVEMGFLTRLQREAVDPRQISAFFTSPLGQAMTASPVCRREFKFSLLVPARDYFPEGEFGEMVLLQGVVDVWFEDKGGLTVVDFKSDRISTGGELARSQEYRSQMMAYGRALSAILGRPVNRMVLWFFATGQGVEVGPA